MELELIWGRAGEKKKKNHLCVGVKNFYNAMNFQFLF